MPTLYTVTERWAENDYRAALIQAQRLLIFEWKTHSSSGERTPRVP